MTSPAENPEQQSGLSVLVRDIVVFQFKLLVDGFRDLVLVPASLVAGLVSLVKTRDGEPGGEFYKVVALGKESERWINLFGALKNAPQDVADEDHFGHNDIDEIVSKVEAFVIDEYKRGGVSSQARDSLQKAMDRMRRGGTKPPP